MYRLLIVLAVLLSCSGCVDAAKMIEALGHDENQNCFTVTTIYGSVAGCRAAKGNSITMPSGQKVDAAPAAGSGAVSVPVTVPPMTLTPSPKP